MSQTYILNSSSDTERRRRERDRLDVLHAATGPWTTRVLRERGVAAGWRCLDVGAGAGHLSRWLAGRGAEVVATDIDTYFLEAEVPAGVEVRRHDILEGPVAEAAFDLVVARAVVVHVRDRARALRHMAAGLKPGGWLVVVDPSLPQTPRLLRAADPALHARVFAAWAEFLTEVGAGYDAATAALMAEDLGLEASGEGLVQLLCGGRPPARLWSLTLAASAGPAADPEDVRRLVAMMDEPAYRAVQLLGHATWARKPA